MEKYLLAAVDHDDECEALKPSLAAWASNGGRIGVLGVAPSLSPAMTNLKSATLAKEAESLVLESLRERVDALSRELGRDTLVHMTAGSVANEIIKHAIVERADIVMKAADRAAGEKAPLFGSVEKKLIRKCPVPVWIVRPEKTEPPKRIVAAIDNPKFADHPAEAEILAATIVQHAADIATRLGVREVTLVHAWSPASAAIFDHPRARLSPDAVAGFVAEWEHLSREWLFKAVGEAEQRFSGQNLSFKPHLATGDPATAIADAVNELKTDLLLIGSVNRTGAPGLFIGNTAESVIDRVTSSVYVVKPVGLAAAMGGTA